MYDPNYSKMDISEVKNFLTKNRVNFDVLSDKCLRVWLPSNRYTSISVSEDNIVYLGWNPVNFESWLYQVATTNWEG